MRADMGKVVVERPRRQSYVPNRKFGARLRYIPDHDYDEQPKRVGISASYRDYSYSEKWSKDLLGPLERFLQKNIGQAWDKVYSEACSTLDRREITGHHLIIHLKDEVETNCFIGANGRVWHTRWRELEVEGFYVHPLTGLLSYASGPDKRALKRQKLLAEEVTRLQVDDETGYWKHEGIWYRVKLKRVFAGWTWRKRPITVRDIFLKKDVKLEYGWYLVAIAKKQCNRDELKKVRNMLSAREWRIRHM